MALIYCSECGKQASDKAPACPHCGAPINTAAMQTVTTPGATPAKEKMSTGKKVLIGFGIFMALGVLGSIMNKDDGTTTTSRTSSSSSTGTPRVAYAFSVKEQSFIDYLLEYNNSAFAKGKNSTLGNSLNGIIVSPEALYRAYDQNEVAANLEYKNKPVLIRGKVDDILTGFRDKPFVTLGAGGFLKNVHAEFHKDVETQKIAAIRKNQTIVLLCHVRGSFVRTPMLDDCQFAADVAATMTEKTRTEIQTLEQKGGHASVYTVIIALLSMTITNKLDADSKCSSIDVAACEREWDAASKANPNLFSTSEELQSNTEKLKAAGWSWANL